MKKRDSACYLDVFATARNPIKALPLVCKGEYGVAGRGIHAKYIFVIAVKSNDFRVCPEKTGMRGFYNYDFENKALVLYNNVLSFTNFAPLYALCADADIEILS